MSDEADRNEARKWAAPAIDGTSDQGFLTAAGLEQLQRQAYDEAFAAGHEEGVAAGAKEVARRAERFDELLTALARPFDELDESVEKQLVELAMTVVKQLFRREIKMEPTHVVGVVREAIQMLPAASRNVLVRLHPDDAELVREALSPAEGERAWSIVEDPLISRGGCTVTSDDSQVDARAETRVNAIVSAITGDERQ